MRGPEVQIVGFKLFIIAIKFFCLFFINFFPQIFDGFEEKKIERGLKIIFAPWSHTLDLKLALTKHSSEMVI